MKILIVEDSERLRRSLSKGFSELGYAVDAAEDGEIGLSYAKNFEYDIIILDIMLPKLDGISVLKELKDFRIQSNIIILSAKDRVKDRVNGLNFGADDYLCKPFSFDELHARVLTLIRRANSIQSNTIVIKNISLDIQLKQVIFRNKLIRFTHMEYSIFEKLALNSNKVISSTRLSESISDSETFISNNSIEVHISSVRKKLKHAGVDDVIETKRNFGYVIIK